MERYELRRRWPREQRRREAPNRYTRKLHQGKRCWRAPSGLVDADQGSGATAKAKALAPVQRCMKHRSRGRGPRRRCRGISETINGTRDTHRPKMRICWPPRWERRQRSGPHPDTGGRELRQMGNDVEVGVISPRPGSRPSSLPTYAEINGGDRRSTSRCRRSASSLRAGSHPYRPEGRSAGARRI